MSKKQPILIGEVLFDVFEQDQRVLGGATFNAAWDLQGLGQHPLLISAVGDDELGHAVQEAMREWQMDTSGLQMNREFPTGTVQVTVNNGQPSYEIVNPAAYDFIQPPDTQRLQLNEGALLYHGSLAARNEVSRETIFSLRQDYELPAFIDINLRDPWWSKAVIETSLHNARWAKLNDDEVHVLADLAGCQHKDVQDRARFLKDLYRIGTVIITLGAEGAVVLDEGQSPVHAKAEPAGEIKDTVGAGDALSSVCMLGILEGWEWDQTLERATTFAAAVCTLQGATTTDRSWYEQFLNSR